MNIFIAKLSGSTTGDDLRELFEAYGEVTSAKVIMDRDTGNSKRFGFVEMDDDTAAKTAIDELDGRKFDGSQIVVKQSQPGGGNKPQGRRGFRDNRRRDDGEGQRFQNKRY